MSPGPVRVLLLAGETSGDRYGADVAAALRTRLPDVRMIGTGGPRMAAQGVEMLAGLEDLAVMGFGEVLGRLAFFRRLERTVRRRLDRDVDVVVPVDFPGFNMRVLAAAHRRGVPVVWYVAPKFWAWKPGRARRLAAEAAAVAVIFPFERPLLEAAGARVEFVGNPLLDRPDDVPERSAFLRSAGVDPGRPVLGLLPGSRRQEIDRHLDLFVATAARIREARPDVQPVLGRAPDVAAQSLDATGLPVVSDARALQRHATALLVKSGTATLETALEGSPFVVTYRTSRLTWWIARRLVRVDHVSLPNLILDERVVPELLQDDATPETLAAALLPLLDSESAERRTQLGALAGVRAALGTPGAAGRVADLVLEAAGIRT